MLGVVVALLVLGIGGLWFVQRGEALPNTTLAGMDVSGLTRPELRDVVAEAAAEREQDEVTFTFEGDEHTLVPAEVGYRIDIEASVERALSRGRSGLPGDIATRIASLRRGASYELAQRPDEPAVEAWVDDLADQLDRQEQRGDVEVDPGSLEVRVEPSHGMVEVRREETVDAILGAIQAPGAEEQPLPAETTPQPISNEELDATAAQVESAIEGPLVLRSDDAELSLAPADLAQLLSVEADSTTDDTTLQIVVTESAVDEVIGDVAPGRFDVEPVSATYTRGRTPPVTFDDQGSTTFQPVEADVEVTDGRNGRSFDPALAAEQLSELLREGAREAEIALETVEPELTNDEARDLRPSHLIGTFTTYHAAGQTRVHNIQRLADVVDNDVVLPAEQFSINELSGERRCDKGYAPAGTIVAGELVDTCGGGVSQFGTTTFNAAFFAGVQLDQWKAHSWYISRYPMGREATLSYPQLDVKFTNNTDGAILVKTSYTASSITVSVYGQPRASAVSATHGQPFNHRGYDTEVRTTNELYEGQESVVQSGAGGFTVQVNRTVDLIDGGTEERTIRTVYVPQTRIVERGTAPRPSSNDDDDAQDDDQADGDDD